MKEGFSVRDMAFDFYFPAFYFTYCKSFPWHIQKMLMKALHMSNLKVHCYLCPLQFISLLSSLELSEDES